MTHPLDVLTTAEVAAMLRISIRTLERHCLARRIAYSQPGRRRVFLRSDVDAFISAYRLDALKVSA